MSERKKQRNEGEERDAGVGKAIKGVSKDRR